MSSPHNKRLTLASDHPSFTLWTKLKRFDFLLLTQREMNVVLAVLLALAAVLLWFLFAYFQPPPPKVVRIATGMPSGAYFRFAKAYESHFAKHGVKLEVIETSGSVDNLQRLNDPKRIVDLAFVQGGTGTPEQYPRLEALASVAHEPIWVFYNRAAFSAELDKLALLRGKRVAVGPPGSGVRVAALELLKLNQIGEDKLALTADAQAGAMDLLREGKLDAVFLVAAIESPVVAKALADGVPLVNLAGALAYERLIPWAWKVTLPRGGANMAADLPPHDVDMVASTAILVARNDLHRAIMYLALEAAKEVHQGATALGNAGDFPATKHLDYPQAEESDHFFKSGPPMLRQYVPFWLANLLERLLLLLAPILAIGIPLAKLLPSLKDWKEQSELTHLYDEILSIEYGRYADDAGRAKALHRLDEMEHELPALGMTAHYFKEILSLKDLIGSARERLKAAT
jgi:TRAP transporter TAXI family solute receptor